MVSKESLRGKDLKKINAGWEKVVKFCEKKYGVVPFCNRCKGELKINEKEIYHIEYDASFRRIEVVCRVCHQLIEKCCLPKYEKIRDREKLFVLDIMEEMPGFEITPSDQKSIIYIH